MRFRLPLLLLFLTLIMGYLFLLLKPQTPEINELSSSAPPLTATLVHPQTAPYYNDTDWGNFYRELKNLGFDTIILTASGLFTREPCNPQGQIKVTNWLTNTNKQGSLTEALTAGLDVYLGILINNACTPLTFVGQTANQQAFYKANQAQLNFLKDFLTDHNLLSSPHLKGVYLSPEANLKHIEYDEVSSFYQTLVTQANTTFPGKKTLVSPWYNGQDKYELAESVKTMAQKTKVNIIAIQDKGAGREDSERREASVNQSYFLTVASATNSLPNFELWGNIESLIYQDGQYYPKTIADLSSYLEAIAPHTDKLMTWIYQFSLAPWDQPSTNYAPLNPDKTIPRHQLRADYYTNYLSGQPLTITGHGHFPDHHNLAGTTTLPAGTKVPAQIVYQTTNGDFTSYLTTLTLTKATSNLLTSIKYSSLPENHNNSNLAVWLFPPDSPPPPEPSADPPSPSSEPPSSLAGDLNGSGQVDLFDFNLLITNFGNPYTIFDFNQIITNYGRSL